MLMALGMGWFFKCSRRTQSITKINKIKIKQGMILSNEPGYYKRTILDAYENLVYVDKENGNLIFKNLTMAPIEKI